MPEPDQAATFKTVIGLLAVFFTPIAVVSTYALITALDAKEIAITSRPFPYTSLDAERDRADVRERIRDLRVEIRRECELNLGRLNLRIDNLKHELEQCLKHIP